MHALLLSIFKVEENMRNTTMRETLEAALSVQNAAIAGRSNDEILSAVKATRRELRKEETEKKLRSITAGKHEVPPKSSTFARLKNSPAAASPRYVAPPSKQNPFSRHAYAGEPHSTLLDELAKEAKVASQQASEPASEQTPELASPAEPVSESTKPSAEHWFGVPASQRATPATMDPSLGTPAVSESASQQASEEQEEVLAEPEKESEGPVLVPPAPVLTLVGAPQTRESDEAEELMRQVPANLEWLERPSPFSGHLRGMVDSLRDARSKLNFILEQATKRSREFREKLEQEEAVIQRTREEVRQIDDAISACALVAEQSASIKPELLQPAHAHKTAAAKKAGAPAEGAKKGGRWSRDDAFLRTADAEAFFAANPGTNWTAGEIRATLPASKQEHARNYMPVLLSQMYKAGKIQRVGVGIYRAMGS